MISYFQNGQVEPSAYIVLFSLLFSPVVCAGLMYMAERNKQYFKEDFLGAFLGGAFFASSIFAFVCVLGLITVLIEAVNGSADATEAKMSLLMEAMFAICAVAIKRS